MNKTKLLQIIENPNQLTENDLEHLEELIATYPFCQIAHLLIAKFTHDHQSVYAPQKIRRAAAFALDRAMLRQLILGKNGKWDTTIPIQLKTQVDQLDRQTENITQNIVQEEVNASSKTSESVQENNNSISFFDQIESDTDQEVPVNDFSTSNKPQDMPKVVSEGLISEETAIALYHEGKEKEAIKIYEQLTWLHPERRQYFINQIAILKGSDFNEEDKDLHFPPQTVKPENNTASFFENLEIEEEKSPEIVKVNLDSKDESHTIYEDFNEGKAMGLYYDGKVEEAVGMYYKLMELYPEQKNYYQQQLTDLIGNDAIGKMENNSDTQKPENKAELSSFFEGINTSEDDSEKTLEILNKTKEIIEEKSKSNTASFFDQIDNKAIDSSKNDLPLETEELYEESSINIPDVSALEPKGLDNEEETDYINESEAILLFNQGKNAEAIRIYENLILKNPQKASYYRSQIHVLKDSENNANTNPKTSTPPEKSKKDLPESFTPIDLDAYTEEISERAAIQLFNLGNTEEAIAVYEKLILKFPEKKNYFMAQIEILKS